MKVMKMYEFKDCYILHVGNDWITLTKSEVKELIRIFGDVLNGML